MKDKIFINEMKAFNINVDDIEPSENLFGAIYKAIIKMKYEYFADRLEVILNTNLIDIKDKLTNYHTIFGCKISYDDLPTDVSFIVKPTQELTYEELQQENKQMKEEKRKVREYIKTTDKWLCRVNDNLCVETIGKDKLLEIIGDDKNE